MEALGEPRAVEVPDRHKERDKRKATAFTFTMTKDMKQAGAKSQNKGPKRNTIMCHVCEK